MCIKNGPSPKRHPANLTQLWEVLESKWARPANPVESVQLRDESGGAEGATQYKDGVPNVWDTQCM